MIYTHTQKAIVPIGILVIICLGLYASQVYIKRGILGRLKSAVDDIGDQFNPGNTSVFKQGKTVQYEPYYLSTNYSVGGFQQSVYGVAASIIPGVRKLIQRAELTLEVKSSQETALKIAELVTAAGGFIIDSQIQKSFGDNYSGKTVFKIAPGSFNGTLEKIKSLGRVDIDRVTGEDVTEEYVDLSARLKNSQAVQERLINILQVKSKDVKDILEVEREIARVGGDIERLEGRMKYLDNLATLATVTVSYNEARPIAPATLNVINKFKQTLHTSLEVALNVFTNIIIFIAFLIPVGVWLGIGYLGFSIFKRLRK